MNRPVPGPLQLAGADEACGISQLFPVPPGALSGPADMTMRSGPGRDLRAREPGLARAAPRAGLRSASLLIEASRRGGSISICTLEPRCSEPAQDLASQFHARRQSGGRNA
jgi:hypothetical protein